jgi:hypothetical protein
LLLLLLLLLLFLPSKISCHIAQASLDLKILLSSGITSVSYQTKLKFKKYFFWVWPAWAMRPCLHTQKKNSQETWTFENFALLICRLLKIWNNGLK